MGAQGAKEGAACSSNCTVGERYCRLTQGPPAQADNTSPLPAHLRPWPTVCAFRKARAAVAFVLSSASEPGPTPRAALPASHAEIWAWLP